MDASYTFPFNLKWFGAIPLKLKLIVNYDLTFDYCEIDGLTMDCQVKNFEIEIGGTVIEDDMTLAETRGELLEFILEQAKDMDLKAFDITEDEAMQEVRDRAEAEANHRYLMEVTQ